MRKKKFSVKYLAVFSAIAVVITVIFLIFSSLAAGLRGGILFLGYPFQKSFQWTTDNVLFFLKTVSTIKDLAKDNKKLEGENLLLLSENAQLMVYKRENEVLRNQLGLKPEREKETKLTAARVIGRDPQKSDYYFFIDKGTKDGIAKDYPVVVNGVLAGFVSEANYPSSKVATLFALPKQIGAFLQTPEGARLAEGVLKNDLNSGLYMDLIVQDKNVPDGSLIIDSASGLIIGSVGEVSGSDVDVFQKIRIKPAFDYEKLETVFVVNP